MENTIKVSKDSLGRKIVNGFSSWAIKNLQKFATRPAEGVLREYKGYCNYSLWGDGTSAMPITLRQAYFYFEFVSPLTMVVRNIATSVSDLPLGVKVGPKSNDIDLNHPIIKALFDANREISTEDFLTELAVSFLLTEEAWPIFRGPLDSPPVAASYVRPYNVNNTGTLDKDGFPASLTTTAYRDRRTYHKVIINNQRRYIDNKEPRLANNEIIPIIGIVKSTNEFRGLSRINSFCKALDQMYFGDIYNSKLLQRGLRPWLVLTPKESLTEKDLDDLEKSLEQIQGVEKVGGIFVLPTNVQSISEPQKNRELEYQDLLKEVKERISASFAIPMPLVATETMTFSNYDVARVAFYDQPIKALVRQLFPNISANLAARLKLTGRFKIQYNPNDIPDLQMRQALIMEKLRLANVLTVNEIRVREGYDPVPGGDVLFEPINKMPIEDLATANYDTQDQMEEN